MFFEDIILDGSFGKTKYYAICIEFQERGSPHVHSFIWILDPTNVQDEAVYISFIEKTINAQLPASQNDSELFELVKTYQVYANSRTCWKYNKHECRFSYGGCFTEKTIIAKPVDSEISKDKKQEILTWRKTVLRKVKNYIDDNLKPAKVHVVDPTKDSFTQPLSIQDILNEVEISEDDYYKALSISKDKNSELHLKSQPNSCFFDNHFDVGLKAWQANIDIQAIFNEYKAVNGKSMLTSNQTSSQGSLSK